MSNPNELLDLHWEDVIVSLILPHLSLRECFNFRCVSKKCRDIVDIHLARIKDLSLIDLHINPSTFRVLANSCTQLTKVNLFRCYTITDQDLFTLFQNNPKIAFLNLGKCKTISSVCLQSLILHNKQLETLHIGVCSWLTSGALESLALHLDRLREVDFSYCSSISESSLIMCFKKFTRLRSVCLRGNTQITDRSLNTLAKYNTELQFLNVDGCDVTDVGIRALGKGCPKLESLSVAGCAGVTETGINLLQRRMQSDRRTIYDTLLTRYHFRRRIREFGRVMLSWNVVRQRAMPRLRELNVHPLH